MNALEYLTEVYEIQEKYSKAAFFFFFLINLIKYEYMYFNDKTHSILHL